MWYIYIYMWYIYICDIYIWYIYIYSYSYRCVCVCLCTCIYACMVYFIYQSLLPIYTMRMFSNNICGFVERGPTRDNWRTWRNVGTRCCLASLRKSLGSLFLKVKFYHSNDNPQLHPEVKCVIGIFSVYYITHHWFSP